MEISKLNLIASILICVAIVGFFSGNTGTPENIIVHWIAGFCGLTAVILWIIDWYTITKKSKKLS